MIKIGMYHVCCNETVLNDGAWLLSEEKLVDGTVRSIKGRLFYAVYDGKVMDGGWSLKHQTAWYPVDLPKETEESRKTGLTLFKNFVVHVCELNN
jgi:hypothetical protein